MTKLSIYIFSIVLLSVSCTYNNEDETYGDCISENISYEASIKPFIENNCISCHNSGNSSQTTIIESGGISYSSFDLVKENILNGNFIESIKHENGISQMPPSGNKTDDCKIKQIEAWMLQGAQEN